MALRIATFNVENIRQRFDFSGYSDLSRRDPTLQIIQVESAEQFRMLEQARVIAHTDDKMQLAALAIADTEADIVCLQEVENIGILEAFEAAYLRRIANREFPHRVLVDGNDGRGVDVAMIACAETGDGDPIEVTGFKSHAAKTFAGLGLHDAGLEALGIEPESRIFRRDCLEIDVRIAGRALTLFVVHFKSMSPGRNGIDGRRWSMPVRRAEAAAVRRIVEDRFGQELAPRRRWLICGDFNDYRQRLVVSGSHRNGYRFSRADDEDEAGFDPLVADGFALDLVARRPADDRWTLYHNGGPAFRHLCQLDYLLASPALANRNPNAVPDIIRNGLPWRTPLPPGQEVERYPRIGWDRPKSSDHCPVCVTLNII
jgi:predicted extracellular nuclease